MNDNKPQTETINFKEEVNAILKRIQNIEVVSMYKIYCNIFKDEWKSYAKKATLEKPAEEETMIKGYRVRMFKGKEVIYTRTITGQEDKDMYALAVLFFEDILNAGIQCIVGLHIEEKKLERQLKVDLSNKDNSINRIASGTIKPFIKTK
jgi:hypothetical protein